MSTNDIIIGKVSKGSFKFPIEFQMFGNLQLIPNADMELNEARYKMEEFLKKCDVF